MKRKLTGQFGALELNTNAIVILNTVVVLMFFQKKHVGTRNMMWRNNETLGFRFQLICLVSLTKLHIVCVRFTDAASETHNFHYVLFDNFQSRNHVSRPSSVLFPIPVPVPQSHNNQDQFT